MKTAVSVVIPCYNGARFLAEAITSALEQTYPNVEVIVLDDGSTDNTRQVAASYGQRVRYLYQENAGLSAARNAAIQAASHDLICLLDSDDRLLPDMIETMTANLSVLPADFGLIACHASFIDADGRPLPARSHARSFEGTVSARDLILMNRFPCTVVIKREVFEQCGCFDTSLRSSEDRDMWIRAAARYRIHLLAAKLVCIRRHGLNMSKNAVVQSRSIRQVLNKAFRAGTVPRWNLLFWGKAGAVYFFQSAFMFAEAQRPFAASVRFLGSICLWPWFIDSRSVAQLPLFRIRRLARILLEALFGTAWRAMLRPKHYPHLKIAGHPERRAEWSEARSRRTPWNPRMAASREIHRLAQWWQFGKQAGNPVPTSPEPSSGSFDSGPRSTRPSPQNDPRKRRLRDLWVMLRLRHRQGGTPPCVTELKNPPLKDSRNKPALPTARPSDDGASPSGGKPVALTTTHLQ